MKFGNQKMDVTSDGRQVAVAGSVDFIPSAKNEIDLWGHRFAGLSGDSIECEHCNETEEIPEILTQSTGFVQTIWRLYILGKFKNEASCKSEYELLEELEREREKERRDRLNPPLGYRHEIDRPQYDPNSVNWTDDYIHMPDGKTYVDSGSDKYLYNIETGEKISRAEAEQELADSKVRQLTDDGSATSETDSDTSNKSSDSLVAKAYSFLSK
jgi:uncharacterized membrane-anchored protein